MLRSRLPLIACAAALLVPGALPAQLATEWTFAASGDSRNCGDFVMPAIAAQVRAEHDAFYWHLGDFRWMSQPDQDLVTMLPAGQTLAKPDYQRIAWDDFITHQLASFGSLPVFLARGNHENVAPMTRDGYTAKFSAWLDRPEIAAQRKADGAAAAPLGPWYHWTEHGIDFITLDNASYDEFSDAQLRWLRGVLDRDLAPNSGVRTIIAGMHEALPHSTGAEHAMDDWELGRHSGEQVYQWFAAAQTSGKHVYLIASHSHYYSPDVFDTEYWREHGGVVLGWIMGAAGARRYKLPPTAHPGAKTHFYGYMQGRVQPDGSISFTLHELSEADLVQARWPGAPLDAIHDCFIRNADE